MTKWFFIIILSLVANYAKAQDSIQVQKKDKIPNYDTSYFNDLSDKVSLYFNITGKLSNIDISSNEGDKQLLLKANGNTLLGLGIDTKWIGLSFSFSLPTMNKDEEIYGKTESFDIQVNYYANSFGIDAWAKHYKGFYLDNPEDFVEWPNPDFPLLNNLETYAVGISGYYFFNHNKFSYKAAFPRTMFQKKSAGSFILGLYANRNVTDAPDGVVPPELPDSLNENFDIRGFSGTMTGITFGYTYSWVIKKKFLINFSLVPGLGYAWTEIQTSLDNIEANPAISAALTTRLAMGYEGKHFYAGFNVVAIADNFAYENIDVSSTTGNLRFFVGKRFDVKKWFKK